MYPERFASARPDRKNAQIDVGLLQHHHYCSAGTTLVEALVRERARGSGVCTGSAGHDAVPARRSKRGPEAQIEIAGRGTHERDLAAGTVLARGRAGHDVMPDYPRPDSVAVVVNAACLRVTCVDLDRSQSDHPGFCQSGIGSNNTERCGYDLGYSVASLASPPRYGSVRGAYPRQLTFVQWPDIEVAAGVGLERIAAHRCPSSDTTSPAARRPRVRRSRSRLSRDEGGGSTRNSRAVVQPIRPGRCALAPRRRSGLGTRTELRGRCRVLVCSVAACGWSGVACGGAVGILCCPGLPAWLLSARGAAFGADLLRLGLGVGSCR